MAPSDYWFYNTLKNGIKGDQFSSLEEVKEAVKNSLDSITQEQYARAYQNWPRRWKLCMDNHGEYLPKKDL